MSIEKIWAREILDSRGNPTVEVDLHTAKGNGHLPTAPGLDVPTGLEWEDSQWGCPAGPGSGACSRGVDLPCPGVP